MLCGYPPFYSEVPSKQMSHGMRRKIMAGEYDFPEKEWSKVSTQAKDCIARRVFGSQLNGWCIPPIRIVKSNVSSVGPSSERNNLLT